MLSSLDITLSNVKTRLFGYDKNEANSKMSLFSVEYLKLKADNEELEAKVKKLESTIEKLNLSKYELEKENKNQKEEIEKLTTKVVQLKENMDHPHFKKEIKDKPIIDKPIIDNSPNKEEIFIGEVEDKKSNNIMIENKDDTDNDDFEFI